MTTLSIPSKDEFLAASGDLLFTGIGIGASAAAAGLTISLLTSMNDGTSNINKLNITVLGILGTGSLVSGIILKTNSKNSSFLEGASIGLTAFGAFMLIVIPMASVIHVK